MSLPYGSVMTVFHKMHGLGNHFVIVDMRDQDVDLSRFLGTADARTGIGWDQLITLEKSDKADVKMRIYNVDGSDGGMCGNATRCLSWLESNRLGKNDILIENGKRLLTAHVETMDLITVNMGLPHFNWRDIPLARDCDTLALPDLPDELPQATAVALENPHCVLFYDDLDSVDTAHWGYTLERHPLFPAKTNVEFCQVLAHGHVRMIVWERGVGFTQSCGSASCGVAFAAIRRGLTSSPLRITAPGGTLVHEWAGGDADPMFMTGPIAYVYEGKLPMAI